MSRIAHAARAAGLGSIVITLVFVTPLSAGAVVETEPVVEHAEFPTNIAVAPDGRIFYAEKDTGKIRVVKDGKLLDEPFAELDISQGPESGLLGIAIDPATFSQEPWVYVLFSDPETDRNEVIRLMAEGDRALGQESVFHLLPTAINHNGGDIAFGPDDKLYVTVGEALQPDLVQDEDTLNGKILRLNPDGSIPEDNPFGPDNPAYSMGHRNSFGICFDGGTDELWETENGPESNDEVNKIVAGANYGWPEVTGNSSYPAFTNPVLDYEVIIVPTGCAAFDGKVIFGDFGGHLRAFDAADPKDLIAETLPAGVTDVVATDDGTLYVATQDQILKVTDLEVTVREPEPSPSPAPPSDGSTTLPVVWVAGIVALLAVVAGGFLLRRLQRRDPPPPPAAEPPGAASSSDA